LGKSKAQPPVMKPCPWRAYPSKKWPLSVDGGKGPKDMYGVMRVLGEYIEQYCPLTRQQRGRNKAFSWQGVTAVTNPAFWLGWLLAAGRIRA